MDILHLETADLFAREPCVLLVHEDPVYLRRTAQEMAGRLGWPAISIGRLLSERLLDVPATRRPREAPTHADELLRERAPGPLVCTSIDLLFHPSLELNPLTLFRNAARATRLVVAWPGSYRSGLLAYAVPEHGHHRYWRDPEATIYSLE